MYRTRNSAWHRGSLLLKIRATLWIHQPVSEHTVMDIKERQMERVTPGPPSSMSGYVVKEKIACCLALVFGTHWSGRPPYRRGTCSQPGGERKLK